MMKRYFLLFLAFTTLSVLRSQHAPVANDDYAAAELGMMVTVNVVENDSHPDGLSFTISGASLSSSFTDSTITFSILYDRYYNIADTIRFRYSLKDENGVTGEESIGNVFIIINNNSYYDYLDHNNIKARVQASGLQFYQGPIFGSAFSDDGVFEFPKNSGKNTIFNSTLWVGGLDENDTLKLAAELYRHEGMDYWTGPLSTHLTELSIDTNTAVKWQHVWKLTKDEIVYHKLHYWQTDYQLINDIATWPAHGDKELNQSEFLAPFVDIDGDSTYNPMAGDYPLIRGDQCIYFIINDLRPHTETGGVALGLEIHGMAYEFNSDESIAMNNTVFYSYKIFNKSTITYHDTYIGLFTDFDIGYSDDDYVGCDVVRGTYYGYNGDSIDGPGVGQEGTYGGFSPAQGIVILGGPVMDANGQDDPEGMCDAGINGVGFSDGITDNERYGMKKFIWFNKNLGVQGDPKTAIDYYNYLKSIWRDRTAMEYGGNGHVSSGAYGPFANFMFPGLSDPCFWGTGGEEPFGPVNWTEVSAGNFVGDRRGLSVMGPFTFEAGAMERVDIAYVAAFPEDNTTAVESLLGYVDEVRFHYRQNPTYFGYQWLGVDENTPVNDKNKISIYPNPVSNTLTFTYSGQSEYAVYKLTDIMGTTVMTDQLAGNESHTLDVSSLKPGMYVLTITGTNGMVATKVLKN
jgi:hypothetical protein